MPEESARRRNLMSLPRLAVLVPTFRLPRPMSEIRRQIVFLDEQLLVRLYVTPEDVGLAVVKVPRGDEHQVILPDPDAPLHLPSDSAEATFPSTHFTMTWSPPSILTTPSQ